MSRKQEKNGGKGIIMYDSITEIISFGKGLEKVAKSKGFLRYAREIRLSLNTVGFFFLPTQEVFHKRYLKRGL